MSKFYNVYRMQILPETSKLVQVAEHESYLKACGHILDDECELYEFAADIVEYEFEEMVARDFFDSEEVQIGQDRVLKQEEGRLTSALVSDYMNDTKVLYLIEEVN